MTTMFKIINNPKAKSIPPFNYFTLHSSLLYIKRPMALIISKIRGKIRNNSFPGGDSLKNQRLSNNQQKHPKSISPLLYNLTKIKILENAK